MTETTAVLIAIESRLYSEVLRSAIDREDDLSVVAEASSAEDAISSSSASPPISKKPKPRRSR